MDELIKLVSEKAGISEDTARSAVSTVIDYLKQKLPAPIAGQFNTVLGSGAGGSGLQNLTGGLDGLLGR